MRVGYAWAGSPGHQSDKWRSTDRAMWDRLLALPGIEWVDLQVGRGGTFQPKDWDETARVLATLDLVIAVDTAVVHLAGAMGVPCWVLLYHQSDYRWGTGQGRTPWYADSFRLYRQPTPQDWGPVFAQVEADLRSHLTSHASRYSV